MKWLKFKETIAYSGYDLALMGFFIIGGPFLLLRLVQGKKSPGLKERFGFIPGKFSKKANKRIWIHAVSVGEVTAALPIVKEIRRIRPEIEIHFSTTTPTGWEAVKKRWESEGFYCPLDFPDAVRRALKTIQPDLLIVMETEIWPNLFREVRRQNLPIIILNARLSTSSFRGYQKIKFLLASVLAKVSGLGVQTEEDAGRFRKLGVERKRMFITGNSKFDNAIQDQAKEKADYFRQLLNIKEKRVIVFGSTHPGEEEIILSSCQALLKKHPDLYFILCPRHPERAGKVEELVRAHSFNPRRRSKIQDGFYADNFIILDTVGELAAIYALATLVFIGGSLVPKGGQNMIEPAFWGKPILFGPYVNNFKEIVRIFLEKEAACQVKDGRELTLKLDFFLGHKEEAEEMGRRAKDLIESNQGASRKSAEIILRYLHDDHR